MDRRKFRRIFVLLLVIIIFNFFKFILITDNNVFIFNPSIFPKYYLISNNIYFDGFSILKKFSIEKNSVFYFSGFGKVIKFNFSDKKQLTASKDKVFVLYNNDFFEYNIANHIIYSQFELNEDELANMFSFTKKNNIDVPQNLYLLNLEYNQSFFIPEKYFFLKKNDLTNGVLLHEMSHYLFGYKIKRKFPNDKWPEILCEAVRLKFLSLHNYDLYNKIIKEYKENNTVYSEVSKYPLILKKFSFFIYEFKSHFYNQIISDDDFLNFYITFERRENN